MRGMRRRISVFLTALMMVSALPMNSMYALAYAPETAQDEIFSGGGILDRSLSAVEEDAQEDSGEKESDGGKSRQELGAEDADGTAADGGSGSDESGKGSGSDETDDGSEGGQSGEDTGSAEGAGAGEDAEGGQSGEDTGSDEPGGDSEGSQGGEDTGSGEEAGAGAEDGRPGENDQEEAGDGEDEPADEDAAGEDADGADEELTDPEGISDNDLGNELFDAELFDVESRSTEADFVVDADGVLTDYTGTATVLEIPSTVRKIKDSFLFNNKNITSVIIPSSVTEIGSTAFKNCTALASLELNEGLVTIGSEAFRGTALGRKLATGALECGKLTIPGTVQSIGRGAFCECTYLGEVDFQDGTAVTLEITSSSPGMTFGSCPNLRKVHFPARLKDLQGYFFYNCAALEEVDLPENLESIGESAFWQCSSLKAITFPASMRTVGASAFKGCTALASVELNEGLVSIGANAFSDAGLGQKQSTGAPECGKLVIPGTVQTIGAGAFNRCTYLGEVDFRDGTAEVLTMESNTPAMTFGNCPNLRKVRLPKRLKALNGYSFYRCEKLAELELSENLESMGDGVFFGCESLKAVTFPASMKTVGASVFKECTALEKLELNEGLVTIGTDAFAYAPLGTKSALGKLTIPSTVQTMNGGAFYRCKYLGEVTFANGETVVLTMAKSVYGILFECENLRKVYLPDRLRSIPESMLMYCANLDTVYIPAGVTEFGSGALQRCPKLVIYGETGSAAERYAKKINVSFREKSGLPLFAKSVFLNRTSITRAGESAIEEQIQLIATVLPETAQNKRVSFSTSDAAVAVVDENGLVTLKGYGKAKITATTLDGGHTADCQVEVLRQWTEEELAQIKAQIQTLNAAAFTVCTNRIESVRELPIQRPAGAQYSAAWRLSYVIDTGVNQCDVLLTQEGYQDAVLKGIEVTGYTLEGVTVSAQNQAAMLQAGKTLPLTAALQFAGTGEASPLPAGAYRVEWKSSNNAALTVAGKSNPLEAAATGVKKASGVTVTAKVTLCDASGVPFSASSGNKGTKWFEASVKLGVLDCPVVDGITITVWDAQNQAVTMDSLRSLTNLEQDVTYRLEAKTSAGGVETDSTVTWKSSNTSLATVSKNKTDGKYYLKIKAGTKGSSVISATDASGSKYASSFRVIVKDSTPRLEEKNVVINLYKTALQEEIHLLPSDGYQIDDASLAVLKKDGTASQFEVAKTAESYYVRVKTGQTLAAGKQSLILSVKTEAAEAQPWQLPFTVQVVKQAPKVTLAQEAVDLYQKGGYGTVYISTSETITNISYSSNAAAAEPRLVQRDTDTANGTFTFQAENVSKDNYKKAAAKGKLRITFAGYTEDAAYNKALTLKVNKKLPTVTAEAEHKVLYPAHEPWNGTALHLMDKTNGVELTGKTGVSVSLTKSAPANTRVEIENAPASGGKMPGIQLTALQGAAKKLTLKLRVENTDWYDSVNVSCSVNVQGQPKLSFGSSTVNLNTAYSLQRWEPVCTELSADGFADRKIVSVSVEGKDAKAKEAGRALEITLVESVESGGAQLAVGITDPGFFKKAATYQYVVKATTADGMTAEGTLKIAVKTGAASVSLKAKGSISLLDRENTAIVYTPSVKNYSDTAEKIELYGAGAGGFEITPAEGGKFELRAKQGASLQKKQYKLGALVTLRSGAELTTTIKVTPQHKAPKLQKDKDNIVLFESVERGKGQQQFCISVKDNAAVRIRKIELLNGYDTFAYQYGDDGTGTLRVLDDPSGKVNKKYSLKFAVTFEGAAGNAAPTNVTVKVDYRR